MNSALEYGLSLLTDGRLKEGTTTSHCRAAGIAAPYSYISPLPPPENQLSLAIEAGEKLYVRDNS